MDIDVEKIIQDLTDDYERQGHLRNYQVKRLLLKRGLSAKDALFVYEKLRKNEIVIDEDPDDDTKDTDENDDESEAEEEVRRSGDYDVLRSFIRETSKNLLTHDDEMRLGAAITQGAQMKKALKKGEIQDSQQIQKIIQEGKVARSELITANIRLAMSVAKQYKELTDLDYSDLIQEGIIGLMRAVDRYDYKRGFKFSTYATWWIRQGIHRAMSDKGAAIRLPVHVRDKISKYLRAKSFLQQTNMGEKVSIATIAKELGWDLEGTHFIAQLSQVRMLSLEKPIGSGEISLKETLMADLPDPKEAIDQENLLALINELLNDLTDREADVMRRRFGLGNNGTAETLEEIGEVYHITRERVRQIESKALGKLMHPTRARRLKEFIEGKKG